VLVEAPRGHQEIDHLLNGHARGLRQIEPASNFRWRQFRVSKCAADSIRDGALIGAVLDAIAAFLSAGEAGGDAAVPFAVSSAAVWGLRAPTSTR